MQRNHRQQSNPHQGDARVSHGFGRNGDATMDMFVANDSFHVPPYYRGLPMTPPLGAGSTTRPAAHPFSNNCVIPVGPRTPPPMPRSWDLSSPPKPHRMASTSTPFPYAAAPSSSSYPVQARHEPSQVPRNIKSPNMMVQHQIVGDPSLRIFRVRLPPHLLHLLDAIVLGCEAHAATLPNGWYTKLYSLTKQDIALREIPDLYNAAKPITSYMKRSMMALLGVRTVKTDRNQPHVLKYSMDEGHTGVELHHDKCHVTANLCLSRSSSYVGGGTFFPAARQLVHLEFGEFLIHPGALVHAGINITYGTRHLFIVFANVK